MLCMDTTMIVETLFPHDLRVSGYVPSYEGRAERVAVPYRATSTMARVDWAAGVDLQVYCML